MKMQKLAVAASIALFASAAYAQNEISQRCVGHEISPLDEVLVEIQTESIAIFSTAQRITGYAAILGPGNSQNSVCFNTDSTLVLTLSDSRRYAFRGIEFEYPFGFDPRSSPFKLWVVHPQSIVVHLVPTTGSVGHSFKYTIKVEDLKTGAMISIDPTVSNVPPQLMASGRTEKRPRM